MTELTDLAKEVIKRSINGKKRGRKKLADPKSLMVYCRVSPVEMSFISQQLDKKGITLSEYVRKGLGLTLK